MHQIFVRESDFALIESLSNGFVIRYQKAVGKEMPVNFGLGLHAGTGAAMASEMVEVYKKAGILPKNKEDWEPDEESDAPGKTEKAQTTTVYSLEEVATYCADEDAVAKAIIEAKKALALVKKNFANTPQGAMHQAYLAAPTYYPR